MSGWEVLVKKMDPLSRREFITAGGIALAGAVLTRTAFADSLVEPATVREFVTPMLPYPVAALEPHVDARTMEIHHGKHHEAYTKNLNAAVAKEPALAGQTIEQLMANVPSLPESVRAAVRNNGGGFYNHNLFWEWMSPQPAAPSAELAGALTQAFGGLTEFQTQFGDAALKRFGSGWAWLVRQPGGKLVIGSTPNQDNPLMTGVSELLGQPLLGLDVWEHAYYLHYQNRRADYIKAWWNVVNWKKVNALYTAAKG